MPPATPNPPWTADIDIDESIARSLITRQFPQFSDEPVVPFGQGWDNAAFLVGDRVVFRFPRRREFAQLIGREIAILPRIAPQLPLRISASAYAGMPSDAFPYAFAGYELIRGATLCSIEMSDERRSALAAPLARFLRALHAIDPEPLAQVGLPRDEIGRLHYENRLRLARERALALRHVDVPVPENLLAWLEAHPPVALAHNESRVVHGDLYARHLVIGDDALPAGVIDWGDVHRGDPALDVAIAQMVLPPSAHADFREAYGPIDERMWNAACFRAIYHAILELDYGVRAKDAGMRTIGAAALRYLAEAID